MKRSIFVYIVILLFVSCNNSKKYSCKFENFAGTDSSFVSRPESPKYVNIGFVGDLMMHRWQIERAYLPEKDSFDYSEIFKFVEPYFAKTDFLVGNLETTFAGKNKGRSNGVFGYSCFPFFNAPNEYAIQLKKSGFDMLTFANNHTFDSRFSGICSTLNLLDSLDIMHTGAYRSKEESKEVFLTSIGDFKIGFVAYTNHLNGNYIPDSLDFCVNNYVNFSKEKINKIGENIRQMRKSGVDFIFAFIHFGNEYQKEPNAEQKLIVDSLISFGADAIIGSHPHIVQKMEIKNLCRDGKAQKIPVFYSLGNFISSQCYTNGIPKDIGLFLNFNLVKWNNNVRVKEIECVPTYVYWQPKNIGVLPVLEFYNNKEQYKFLTSKDITRINSSFNSFENILFKDNISHFTTKSKYVVPM